MIERELCLVRSRAKVPVICDDHPSTGRNNRYPVSIEPRHRLSDRLHATHGDIVSQAHQAKAQSAEVLVDEEANVVQAGWSRDADTPRDEWLL
jgi:hypothetical protein